VIVLLKVSSKSKILSLWGMSWFGVAFLHWPNKLPLMWSVRPKHSKWRGSSIKGKGWYILLAIILVCIGCNSQYPAQIETGIPSATPTIKPTPIPTDTPNPSIAGKIAYLSIVEDKDANFFEPPKLFVVDFECAENCDTKVIHLANDVDDLRAPSWSPDGKQIVVAHHRGPQLGQIYVISADDGSKQTLINVPYSVHQPVWSPANNLIAFVDTEMGLRVVEKDSEQSAILMEDLDAFISSLDWSLDGRTLAFEHLFVRGGYHRVYVLAVDERVIFFEETNNKGLTNDNAIFLIDWNESGDSPALSPAGDYMAYVCSDFDTGTNICTVNLITQEKNILTDNVEPDEQPVWSPDGKHVAFISSRDGNREIYVMNSDGSREIRLTSNDADDLLPSWSPDGNYLTFISNRDEHVECRIEPTRGQAARYYLDADCNYEIYIMKLDGTEQRRLTNNDDLDIYPVWAAQ